jgi:hypothetical protein
MSTKLATFAKAALALVFLAAPLAANAQTVRYRVVPLTEIQTLQTSCVPTAINDNGERHERPALAASRCSLLLEGEKDGGSVYLGATFFVKFPAASGSLSMNARVRPS